MTPNGIEVLIHCHVSPAPHPRKDAPAVAEELRKLEANGLIEQVPGVRGIGFYRTTDRGRAHIEQLCSLAWPKQVWIGHDGQPIVSHFTQENKTQDV